MERKLLVNVLIEEDRVYYSVQLKEPYVLILMKYGKKTM